MYTLYHRALLVQWLLAMHSRACQEHNKLQQHRTAKIFNSINKVRSTER